MDILVALDDSDPAREALEFALAEHPDADVTAVTVINPYDTSYGEATQFGVDSVVEARREEAEELFEEARRLASDHDGEFETETLVGAPAREILAYLEDEPVDRVFVGSHGRSGLSRVLLGSVAERIVRRSPVPVTIVR